MSGRTLGIDPGERRIGVALSDPAGMIASPHDVIDRHREDVVSRLRDIVDTYGVTAVVVGLPRPLAGGEGPAARRARELGAQLAAKLPVDVQFFDERYTTVQAESALLEGKVQRKRRREVIDKVAAALMLQGWLDQVQRTDPAEPAQPTDPTD